MGMGGLFFQVRGAFAEELVLTPEQTLGPYYPDRMPLDRDNDLLILNGNITPAVGTVSWISGRILSRAGSPVRGALVEIWQADENGAYIHSASPVRNRDTNFQGYGRFLTGSGGAYLFRTVKPGLYPGRTRHVHFAVTAPGQPRFVTQLYIEGEAFNGTDGVLRGITNAAQRASVVVPWNAVDGSRIGELAARFDVVLGVTPAETAEAERPTIVSMSGIVSAATEIPGVVPGGCITIYGAGLAAGTRNWTAADAADNQLPRTLDGVSVQIGGKAAPVLYISPKQVNVQAPPDLEAGNAAVTVNNASGTSDAVNTSVLALAPGFFQIAEEYVAAVRLDGSRIGPAASAAPGETIVLYGTGFGPTIPAAQTGQLTAEALPLAAAVTVRVDGIVAAVSFAGLASPGLYQIHITVPDLRDGDHAITAEVGGVRMQKMALLRTRAGSPGV